MNHANVAELVAMVMLRQSNGNVNHVIAMVMEIAHSVFAIHKLVNVSVKTIRRA